MPPFSMLYLLAVLAIVLFSSTRKKTYINLLFLTIYIEIISAQGYFISVGSWEVDRNGVNAYMLCIYLIYYICCENIEINKKILIYATVLSVIPLISYAYEIIDPYRGLIISMNASWDDYMYGKIVPQIGGDIDILSLRRNYIILMIYILNVVVFKTVCDRTDVYHLVVRLIKWSKIIIIYGYFEYIIKNILNIPDLTHIISGVFFGINSESIYKEALMRGESYALQGFTKEPSQFVVSLFVFATLILIANKIAKYDTDKKTYKVQLLMIMVLLLLTGGFSALWYLVILIVLYIIIEINFYQIKMEKVLDILIILGGCIAVFYIGFSYIIDNMDGYLVERLNGAMNAIDLISNGGFIGVLASESDYDLSSVARFMSVYHVFNNFLDKPVLGLGLGVTYAHDFTANIFAQIGVIGVYIWCRLLLVTSDCNKKIYDIPFFITYFFIAGIPIGIHEASFFIENVLIVEATSLYCIDKR